MSMGRHGSFFFFFFFGRPSWAEHGSYIDKDLTSQDLNGVARGFQEWTVLEGGSVSEGDLASERNMGDSRDINSVRHRDLREELVNGSYRSSTSTSGSSGGSAKGDTDKREYICGKFADREPGELSSGSSGSDWQGASQSKMLNNGGLTTENEVSVSLVRKRKFSPIPWDRRQGCCEEPAISTSSEYDSSIFVNVPFPPMPEGFASFNSTDMVVSSDNLFHLDAKSHLSVDQCQLLSNDKEPGSMEDEEEYAPARNITVSSN